MEVIKALIAQKYSLVNWTADKKPCGKDGKGLSQWNLLSYAELIKHHDPKSKIWGIKLGKHENNRRLLCFDFDVYGSTHPETPCPFAKEELEQYLADVGEENADGMFWGSTVGNAVLLVDYTDNKTLCDYVDLLNTFKKGTHKIVINKEKDNKKTPDYVISEIELFWGDKNCIVLPPSATICKRANKVVQPRKLLNDKWVCKLDDATPDQCYIVGWMCDHINNLIKYLKKEQQPVLLTPPNSRTATPVIPSGGGKDKWISLLMEYMKNPRDENEITHKIIRADFIKICGALKSNGYDPQVWRDWIALDRDPNKGDGMKTWNSLKTDRKTPMECLKTVAKKYTPEAFTDWKRDFNIVLPHDTLMKGENDIAKFLVIHLEPYLRCFVKIWWIYDERTSLWRKTDSPISFIVTTLQQFIDDATNSLGFYKAKEDDAVKKEKFEIQIAEYLAYRRKCCCSSAYNAIKEILKSDLACDKEWCERFDNLPYKIPYKNGVFCLKTNTFRAGILPTDYLTHTLSYDYEPPNQIDEAWVREELKKICNYNEEHLERYLSQLGYMLCGDPSRIQEFYNFKGEKAKNGKSTILDALTLIMPTFVKKLDSNVFEKSAKATLHKTTATMGGVRIAWLNEVDASATQDEGVLKTWTDGMTTTYNELYSVNMSIKITFKLVVVGNNGMKVKGDAGVMRRMVINQFDSEFADNIEDDFEERKFKCDAEFSKKLMEKKHSLLGLLYKYSKKFCDEGALVPLPTEWKDEKEEVREGLAKFDKWFDINYEWAEGKNDWMAWIDDIENHAKMEKMKHDDIKCELKRMKLWKKPIEYDSQARSHKKKGVFHNLRMREEKLTPLQNPTE